MSVSTPNDRRQKPRANLAAPCPSFFSVQGRRYQAFMVDVSENGAGFRDFDQVSPLTLGPGQKTQFEVITPYGKGSYEGTVAWARQLEGGHAWGLQLNSGLRTCAGPLEQLLDTALPSD